MAAHSNILAETWKPEQSEQNYYDVTSVIICSDSKLYEYYIWEKVTFQFKFVFVFCNIITVVQRLPYAIMLTVCDLVCCYLIHGNIQFDSCQSKAR